LVDLAITLQVTNKKDSAIGIQIKNHKPNLWSLQIREPTPKFHVIFWIMFPKFAKRTRCFTINRVKIGGCFVQVLWTSGMGEH
jgi:hypothetical protein